MPPAHAYSRRRYHLVERRQQLLVPRRRRGQRAVPGPARAPSTLQRRAVAAGLGARLQVQHVRPTRAAQRDGSPTRRRRDAPRRLWNKRSPRSPGAATNAAEKRTEGDRGDPSDATAAASATSDLCIINLLSIGIYLARRASSIAANVASYAARPSSSRVSVSASHTFWSACFKICPPHS